MPPFQTLSNPVSRCNSSNAADRNRSTGRSAHILRFSSSTMSSMLNPLTTIDMKMPCTVIAPMAAGSP